MQKKKVDEPTPDLSNLNWENDSSGNIISIKGIANYRCIEFEISLYRFDRNGYAYRGKIDIIDPRTGRIMESEKDKREIINSLNAERDVGNLKEIYIEQKLKEAINKFEENHSADSPDYESELEKFKTNTRNNAVTSYRRNIEASSAIYIPKEHSKDGIIKQLSAKIIDIYIQHIDELFIFLGQSLYRNEIAPSGVIHTYLEPYLKEHYNGATESENAQRTKRRIIQFLTILPETPMMDQDCIDDGKLKIIPNETISTARVFWKWGVSNKFWCGDFPVEKRKKSLNSEENHNKFRKNASIQNVLSIEEKEKLRDYLINNQNLDSVLTALVASNFSDEEIKDFMLCDVILYAKDKILFVNHKNDNGPLQTYSRYVLPYLAPAVFKYIKKAKSKYSDANKEIPCSTPLFKKIEDGYITKAVRETCRSAGIKKRSDPKSKSVLEYKTLLKNTFKDSLKNNCGIRDFNGLISYMLGEVPKDTTSKHYIGFGSKEAKFNCFKILQDMGPPEVHKNKTVIGEKEILFYPSRTDERNHVSGEIILMPGQRIEISDDYGVDLLTY